MKKIILYKMVFSDNQEVITAIIKTRLRDTHKNKTEQNTKISAIANITLKST